MNTFEYYPEDCIAALATAWGESALAVIRTTGEECIERVSHCFTPGEALLKAPGNQVVHGMLVHPDSGEPIDDVLALVFRAPRSYTGEDSVELSVHGSMAGVEKILQTLYKHGFRRAGPGEFTMRAFLNGKMDLTRAEAVREIVAAKSGQAHSMALHRLSGTIEERINSAKSALLDMMSSIEVQLDYSDEEPEAATTEIPLSAVEEVEETLQRLSQTYRVGRIYQEGVRVVIAGPTNAGKSSLFNLFLREDRSIVSEIHGTTRDFIESWVTIDGVPVRLYDTAGLRMVEHPVEVAGIERSQKLIRNADIILYLVDSTVGLTGEDREVLDEGQFRDRMLLLWNKTDLEGKQPPKNAFPISVESGKGFSRLEEEIIARAVGTPSTAGEPIIDSLRQKELIDRCLEALGHVKSGIHEQVPLDMIALDVQEALQALGEITGEVTSRDILHNMFSKFCVGK
jgi:tRNA modification GTPase